jgi:hypothetical protein
MPNFRLAQGDGVPSCGREEGANQLLQHFKCEAAPITVDSA